MSDEEEEESLPVDRSHPGPEYEMCCENTIIETKVGHSTVYSLYWVAKEAYKLSLINIKSIESQAVVFEVCTEVKGTSSLKVCLSIKPLGTSDAGATP